MAASLEFKIGDGAPARVVLEGEQVRIGRGADCELVLPLRSVSRHHARLLRVPEGYRIEDLGSHNGTYVNGRKILAPVVLKHGDRVIVSEVILTYQDSSARDAAPPPAPEKDYSHDFDDDDGDLGEPVDPAVERTTNMPPRDPDAPSLSVLMRMDARVTMEPQGAQAELRLRSLVELSRSLAGALGVEQVLDRTLSAVMTMFPQADAAAAVTPEAGADSLTVRASQHRDGPGHTPRVSRTVVHQALELKQAILSGDVRYDKRFSSSRSLANFQLCSVMCAPLLAQDGTPLGVIQVDATKLGSQFTQGDLEVLLGVCAQAAIAADNARLHVRLVRQALVEQELSIARRVQAGFLPRTMPAVPGYAFWVDYAAAGDVGGDHYDFVSLPGGRLALLVADVAGKGVPAALLAAKLSSEARAALWGSPRDPARAVSTLNRAICEASADHKFVTMLLAVLDPADHRVVLVNAGHLSPVVRRASGLLEEPGEEDAGLPLGVSDDAEYLAQKLVLERGDSVVLLTDGVHEAMDARDEPFGQDRVHAFLATAGEAPADLGSALLSAVRAYVGPRPPSDDRTIVVFGRA